MVFGILLYFCNGYQSGIRYDLPEVRAVAYRFSTTYLLHSAANYTDGNQDERTPKTGLFRFPSVLYLCLDDRDAVLHFVFGSSNYANHQFDLADPRQIMSHPQ